MIQRTSLASCVVGCAIWWKATVSRDATERGSRDDGPIRRSVTSRRLATHGSGPFCGGLDLRRQANLSRGIEPCILDFWPCVRGHHIPTVGNGAVDEGMHS